MQVLTTAPPPPLSPQALPVHLHQAAYTLLLRHALDSPDPPMDPHDRADADGSAAAQIEAALRGLTGDGYDLISRAVLRLHEITHLQARRPARGGWQAAWSEAHTLLGLLCDSAGTSDGVVLGTSKGGSGSSAAAALSASLASDHGLTELLVVLRAAEEDGELTTWMLSQMTPEALAAAGPPSSAFQYMALTSQQAAASIAGQVAAAAAAAAAHAHAAAGGTATAHAHASLAPAAAPATAFLPPPSSAALADAIAHANAHAAANAAKVNAAAHAAAAHAAAAHVAAAQAAAAHHQPAPAAHAARAAPPAPAPVVSMSKLKAAAPAAKRETSGGGGGGGSGGGVGWRGWGWGWGRGRRRRRRRGRGRGRWPLVS